MTPTVGHIVHYVSYGTPGGEYTSHCRAAVVAGVPEGALPPIEGHEGREWSSDTVVLDLVVLNPTGLFFNRCPQDELPPADRIVSGERAIHLPGTWHWPERADG